MASHVPFLALRPDQQFSDQIKTRSEEDAKTNIIHRAAMADNARGPAKRLSPLFRFLIVTLITLSLSSLLHSLSASFSGPELAAVSRNLTLGWHIGLMLAWKLAELGFAWYARYDYWDVAHLTLLSQIPHYFLLNYFFSIDWFVAVIPLAIDVISLVVPFAVMRQLNHANRNPAVKTENQEVAHDRAGQSLAAVLGSSLYALVVYSAFVSYLPLWMITHFDGVRSLDKAHNSNAFQLLPLFIPMGWAASQFIFVPAIGSAGNPGLVDVALAPAEFDPQAATFGQTLVRNLRIQGGFTPRAEVILKRTLILALGSFINTFFRSYVAVEGTELWGALGWASVWLVAAGVTGTTYAWIGNE